MPRTCKPYGLWKSPLDAESVSTALSLVDVQFDRETGALVWMERRSGQGVLVAEAQTGDASRDLTSSQKVEACVGYGGGEFAAGNGQVYFTSDGQIQALPLDPSDPSKKTPAGPLIPSFGEVAAPTPSPDGRWLVFIHSSQGHDVIAGTQSDGTAWPWKLTEGRDFYMQPSWRPNGGMLAWIAWDHPNMPWNGTGLYLADVVDSGHGPRLDQVRLAAGDPGGQESLSQPVFSPDGRSLAFLSDKDGWARPWILDLTSGEKRPLIQDTEEAEYGGPAWVQGLRFQAWDETTGDLILIRNKNGFCQLERLDVATGRRIPIKAAAEYTWITQIDCRQGRVSFIGSSPSTPSRVVVIEEETARTVRRSQGEALRPSALSQPRTLRIPIVGAAAGSPDFCQGLYYPPHNPEFESRGAPPAIIHLHGGPTSQSTSGYSVDAQFFATRGYAYLALNYRGSSGFGRAYADALLGNWGVLEVEDIVAAADYLAQNDLADGARIAVSGGSAGGYSVLLSLIAHPEKFRAGICRYGVGNLFDLAADTHKFEAHYLDSLIGPLPQAGRLYHERSPVLRADAIKSPLAVFQGGEDKVVPQQQSEELISRLRSNGVPHLYQVYPEEGHGFRSSKNIADYYRQVDGFLRRHLILTSG